MTKKRKAEIVTVLMHEQKKWLMSVEMDKNSVGEALDEALEEWREEDAAVDAVLGQITDRHVECARNLGNSMNGSALRKLFPANVQVDLPPKKGADSTKDVIGG